MKNLFSIFIIFLIFVNPIRLNANEIVLAGGCFWCMEHDLESLRGIHNVKSGYSGGDILNPTYENHAGHQEVVLVNYDCLLYTSPSPRDRSISRMPSSA